jgi:hypothetical protein
MVDAAQPDLKIGEHEVNDGHELCGDLRIASLTMDTWLWL